MSREVQLNEITKAFELFDTLGPDSGCKKQAATIIRSLTDGYIVQNIDGRKIGTIKLVRERTGLGLRDSKEFVEKHGQGYLDSAPAAY